MKNSGIAPEFFLTLKAQSKVLYCGINFYVNFPQFYEKNS
jgi:hypothetical protein